MISLLTDEMIDGLKRRNAVPEFARFRAYSRQKLDSTAGDRMTSEVTGNCRLNWYDHLLRNPLAAPAEAERFTRDLHSGDLDDHEGLDRALVIAGEKLDLQVAPPQAAEPVDNPRRGAGAVRRALTEAQAPYAAALAPLTGAEIDRLARGLYSILTRNGDNGHTLADRSTGRYMCDLLEKVDRQAMLAAARALVPLADPKRARPTRGQLPAEGDVAVEGVTGTRGAADRHAGGRHHHRRPRGRTPTTRRHAGRERRHRPGRRRRLSTREPCSVRAARAGRDRSGRRRHATGRSKPGVQGGAVLGVSMLLDRAGDDIYQANDVAQGSCLGGAGMLIDYAGNDGYVGRSADAGPGHRRRGHPDRPRRQRPLPRRHVGPRLRRTARVRRAWTTWTGEDHYYVGGLYPDSYEETPGYEGWGQGVGGGHPPGRRRRASASSSTAAATTSTSSTTSPTAAATGSAWASPATSAATTSGSARREVAFSGGPRTERRFQRFSNGFGCHYALGFLFDDAGDDTYDGTIMGVGFAWDVVGRRALRFRRQRQYWPPAAAPRATAPRPAWASSTTTPATTSIAATGRARPRRASRTTICPTAAAISAS